MTSIAANNAAFLVLASRFPSSDLIYSHEFVRALGEAVEAATRHLKSDVRPKPKGIVDIFQLTEPELREVIRTAKEAAWDEVVSSLSYPDGSPVEIADNNNPYRPK